MKKRTLYAKDCLDIINNDIPNDSIDLIYLDPPFNSNRNYNLLYKKYYKKKKPVEAFKDTWKWGERCEELMKEWAKSLGKKRGIHDLIRTVQRHVQHDYKKSKDCLPAYILYMAERLIPMRDCLKETGSIYLHCDPTASHYLKMLMDMIFGKENFRNEIVWCYTGPSGSKRSFPRKHDTILRYTQSDNYVFNHDDIRIQYKELHSDKGAQNQIWGEKGKLQDKEVRETYLKKGKIPEDYWLDIPSGGHISPKERLGYPTQKPLKLLERIIKASSNPGDTILDPFCGCGTAVHAAENFKRKWIGIDIAPYSAKLVQNRLLKHTDLTKPDITMRGTIETMDDLHERLKPKTLEARLNVEKEICGDIGCLAIHEGRRPGDPGGDKGVDGVIEIFPFFHKGSDNYKKEKKFCIVQVKSGGVTVDSVKAFNHTLTEDEETMAGVFVCFKKYQTTVENNLTKETFEDGTGKYPIAQACYFEDLLDCNDKRLKLPL